MKSCFTNISFGMVTVSQLRHARVVRSNHRGFALREKNVVSRLINKGWVTDMPIPVKLVNSQLNIG